MATQQITTSSTAEYFAKNLQQVGFSSPTKAVLTTLKEAVDNSLDACEVAEILPELRIEISKVGPGAQKNTDLIRLLIEDNGPGIEQDDLLMVYGEYLASSKFGRGQCTRGQQGIGISAATTWAQLTNAKGARVISKTKRMKKAIEALIDVDIKKNKGVFREKKTIDWDRPHGVLVEFMLDGRVQLNGDGGLMTYLEGTTLVNPHLTLVYKLLDADEVRVERVSEKVPLIPTAVAPHPHTLKLGEFMTHAHLFGKVPLRKFLKTGFTRLTDATITELNKKGIPKALFEKSVNALSEAQFKSIYQTLQDTELVPPSTKSVLSVGEDALAQSILRLGDVDFFSVVTRKPRICDSKPVSVEVALARFKNRGSEDQPLQVLRFANRVPLQFDKAGCAITKAIETVNWRSYGLNQPRNSVPLGPYVFAISVVSPFIKFKNASKETVDASEELVEEIRRACMQAGQKLSRHIRKEVKEADLEKKLQHIEKFGPMLVEGLVRILGASPAREKRAEEGLMKILGRDAAAAEKDLSQADEKLESLRVAQQAIRAKFNATFGDDSGGEEYSESDVISDDGIVNSKVARDVIDVEKVAKQALGKKQSKGKSPATKTPTTKTPSKKSSQGAKRGKK
ncbi:MAG: DNA topoisomerase VI subunit B [Bdellovibrionales bacterium CG10_big_fil_rev_8_21_14_0_10_45_34]|nr:MAG: DNA topoisomerase VI subunit B [Bdellovibrionales bacterium CG10_big_fil_rev_8_21_14_0_10_45_34]